MKGFASWVTVIALLLLSDTVSAQNYTQVDLTATPAAVLPSGTSRCICR